MGEVGDTHFVPNALCIAGLQHICNNLCCDCHTKCEGWPVFWNQLKQVEGLLNRRWRREKYVRGCLRGSPHACFEVLFETFNHSLYEKRWREVIRFLRGVTELLPILRSTFSVVKFRAGAVEGEEQDEGVDGEGRLKFDPVLLQSALRSYFSHVLCVCVVS